MSSISDAIQLAKSGRGDLAAEVLRGEFEKLNTPNQMLEMSRFIAECFEGIQDYVQAGNWFELAGEIVLSDSTRPYAVLALDATGDYTKALTCYTRAEDAVGVEKCTSVLGELRRSCSSS